MVPLWWTDPGEPVLHQVRPDEPRRDGAGRPVKYETPAKASARLDVHPSMRDALGMPAVPLAITEGAKKVDAATTAGICCIGLVGVDGWRGRNSSGGLTALPQWNDVHLKGRTIYLVFDSDVMTKGAVYYALLKLRGWLESKGADVFVVYLPSGPMAAKVGVDDFLAAGHNVDDLLTLATKEIKHPDQAQAGAAAWELGDYVISATSGILRRREDDVRRLADFAAYIARKDIEDDGDRERERDGVELLETQRYHLVIQQGERIGDHIVTAAEFHSMRWPPQVTAFDLVLASGSSVRDQVREAIELVSKEIARQQGHAVIPRHTVFVHTGWRHADEGWIYLHAAGAIGAQGSVENVEVRLSPQFAKMVIPAPPDGDSLVLTVLASLRLLELGPDTLMVPVLGAVYRAVLGPADFALHTHGDSDRFKSEVMALAQSHFGGPFDSRELPLSWTSTSNALEGLLHEAACMATVVDDFLPAGLPQSEREQQLRAAARVFRAQGNRQGRSRMRADTTLRAPKIPRGLVLSTGEEIPPGLSLIARVWAIEQGKGDVTSERLTVAQQSAELCVQAMAGYLRWLAPQMQNMAAAIRSDAANLRPIYRAAHRRTADIACHLELGWSRFLSFALDVGAITSSEHAEHMARVRAALIRGAAEQARHQREVNPVERYVSGLQAALVAGVCHVTTLDGGSPESPDSWGWRYREHGDGGGHWEPRGDRVGWLDEDGLYLLPEVAYRVAAAQHRDGAGIGEHALRTRLRDAGVLASTTGEADGRLTVRAPRAIAGRPRVLHFSAGLFSPGPTGPTGPGPAGTPVPNTNGPGFEAGSGPTTDLQSGTSGLTADLQSGTIPLDQAQPDLSSADPRNGPSTVTGPAGPAGPGQNAGEDSSAKKHIDAVGRGPRSERAAEALARILAAGPQPADEVSWQVQELVGCSDRTVEEVKRRLGIRSERVNGEGGRGRGRWLWRLPDKLEQPSAELPEDASEWTF